MRRCYAGFPGGIWPSQILHNANWKLLEAARCRRRECILKEMSRARFVTNTETIACLVLSPTSPANKIHPP